MRWKFFKSRQAEVESKSIEEEFSNEGIMTSGNASDEPPVFFTAELVRI